MDYFSWYRNIYGRIAPFLKLKVGSSKNKNKSMAQVREIIELLTHVLNENGCTKLKAEVFRLAKFNKDEAVNRSLICFTMFT